LGISVVISTFHRLDRLRSAISSVLSQPDVEVEVVVVDDTPERSAEGIVDEFRDSGLPLKDRSSIFSMTMTRCRMDITPQ
jgi:GT2 family glycosyltransferase